MATGVDTEKDNFFALHPRLHPNLHSGWTSQAAQGSLKEAPTLCRTVRQLTESFLLFGVKNTMGGKSNTLVGALVC